MSEAGGTEPIDERKHRIPVPPLWAMILVLALLLLAGFYFGIWWPWQARQKLVKEFESLGGRVEYRETGPEWLRNLTGQLAYGMAMNPKRGGILDRVISVRICPSGRPRGGRREIPREVIRLLRSFPELQRLDLSYTNVTDDWMPDIAQLKSLERLELGHARVCGRGFHCLADLRDLNRLNVVFCPIRDPYLDHLVKMKSLKDVNLFACSHVTADAVSDLRTARPDCRVHVDQRIHP